MPKETITDVSGAYDVRVGWRADGHVQVGVETAQGYSLVTMLYGEPEVLERIAQCFAKDGYEPPFYWDPPAETHPEFLQRVGRHILNVIEGSPDVTTLRTEDAGAQGSYTGVWSTLNREGCNRLIKAVRRARDAAFGRDE